MTKQWDKYREIIIAEYKENNKPLHEVQRFMQERFGFRASYVWPHLFDPPQPPPIPHAPSLCLAEPGGPARGVRKAQLVGYNLGTVRC